MAGYQVLARRWRPQRFEDLVGQDVVVRTLRNALSSKQIGHAYLFSGLRGVGKTTVARLLAKALNCEHGPTPEPCGACDACQDITNGSSMDVLELDAASNRGIDDVRELREVARVMPVRDRYRVFIVDEAHQLTEAAFNALLKILEEPPAHVIFIMASTDKQKFPATILSRCLQVDFRPISPDLVAARLKDVAGAEGFALSAAASQMLGPGRRGQPARRAVAARSRSRVLRRRRRRGRGGDNPGAAPFRRRAHPLARPGCRAGGRGAGRRRAGAARRSRSRGPLRAGGTAPPRPAAALLQLRRPEHAPCRAGGSPRRRGQAPWSAVAAAPSWDGPGAAHPARGRRPPGDRRGGCGGTPGAVAPPGPGRGAPGRPRSERRGSGADACPDSTPTHGCGSCALSPTHGTAGRGADLADGAPAGCPRGGGTSDGSAGARGERGGGGRRGAADSLLRAPAATLKTMREGLGQVKAAAERAGLPSNVEVEDTATPARATPTLRQQVESDEAVRRVLQVFGGRIESVEERS